jgi:hypothetical protein
VQFPCARCGRAYEIADELVVGRAVRVACPACGNLVVHRVPAGGGALAAPPAPPPPARELAPALWEADDDDFENAWSALEAPPGARSPPASAPVAAPAPPLRAPAPAAAKAPKAPAKPAVRRPPPPTALPDDENVPTVTAELVLIRRSARRSRLTAAAIAIGAVGALVGVGTMGLKWKRQGPVAGAARTGASASAEGAAGSGLSAEDIAKLMGRPAPAPPPEARAPAPAPRAADRPRHEKLAVGDKGLLDLLGKKGDVAVTVQDDDAAALATTRGSLDEASIEGTLSRNSSSFAACVSRAVSADPDQRLAANRVSLELTIRPSGRVQKAAVTDKAVAGTPLGQCISQAAKRMVFPGFDGEPLDIVVPLKLRVGL